MIKMPPPLLHKSEVDIEEATEEDGGDQEAGLGAAGAGIEEVELHPQA